MTSVGSRVEEKQEANEADAYGTNKNERYGELP